MLADQRQKEVKKDVSVNSNTRTSSSYVYSPASSGCSSESYTGTINISIPVLTQSSNEKRKYTNIGGTLESAKQQQQEAAKAGRLQKEWQL